MFINIQFEKILLLVLFIAMIDSARVPAARAAEVGAEAALKSAVSSGKPTLLVFGAVWCPSCVAMHEVIESLKKDKTFAGRLNIIIVDADKDEDLAEKYGIRSIPVEVLLDESGKEVKRRFGAMEKKELVQLLKSSLKFPEKKRKPGVKE